MAGLVLAVLLRVEKPRPTAGGTRDPALGLAGPGWAQKLKRPRETRRPHPCPWEGGPGGHARPSHAAVPGNEGARGLLSRLFSTAASRAAGPGTNQHVSGCPGLGGLPVTPPGGEPVAPSRSNESDHRRLPHPQPRGAGTALRPKAAVARATLSAQGLLPAWRLRLCEGRRWSRPCGCQGLPGLPSARPEVRGPGAGLHGRRPRAVLSETPLSTAAHRDGRKDQPVPGGPPARRKDAPGAGRPLHPVLY